MKKLLATTILAYIYLGSMNTPAAHSRNYDEAATSQEVRQWFQQLKQPDHPHVSCCGEADAYYADSYEINGDEYVAIITDERAVPGRRVIPLGTKIPIPNHKLKFDEGNPTGHGIVFVGGQDQVFCYLAPGGV